MTRRTLLLLTALLAGCGGRDTGPTDAVAPPDESVVERGPVRLTFRVEPGEVTVGQLLTITIEVTFEEGIVIEMPALAEELGPFVVRASRTPPDIPEAGRRKIVHSYDLDTFDTGQLELAPVTVRFVDTRGDEPIEGDLTSGQLFVTVRTVLAEGETESDFRDIKGTIAVPTSHAAGRWWPLALTMILAAVVIGSILAVVLRRRAPRAMVARSVPPHVWALEALDGLEAEGLLAEAEFHAYYVRLSDIVRRYIELRFHLMAPERTTEEFLREAGASSTLSSEHRQMLTGFLRAADMVKFALHVPAVEDADRAMAAARDFVRDTAREPGTVEAAA